MCRYLPYITHMRAKTLKLDRKNLIVDGAKVRRLQRALKVPSESEAVRVAVDRALRGEEAVAALMKLRARGTWGEKIAD